MGNSICKQNLRMPEYRLPKIIKHHVFGRRSKPEVAYSVRDQCIRGNKLPERFIINFAVRTRTE